MREWCMLQPVLAGQQIIRPDKIVITVVFLVEMQIGKK